MPDTDKTQNKNKYINFASLAQVSLVFAIPLALVNLVFNTYLFLNYGYLADIQATSMIFIVAIIGIGSVVLLALRKYHSLLYERYSASRGEFWVSLVVLVPLLAYIRSLLIGTSSQDIGEILVRAGIVGLLFILTSFVFISLLIVFLEKITTRSRPKPQIY